ncbi:hypothetical protein [Xenorhabdus budapestensis]|uniref:Uncharacterized protein n=1 Tax=Xenorhabdus budapestensis TaxID=290110 RepID=A0A2D0IR73_XENBU|nr:hypothetical protein [Xenorhabdus budapestensis]PHM24332.1 hypothetical protein Xbud_03327 [Xenorhabdus budapestensis]
MSKTLCSLIILISSYSMASNNLNIQVIDDLNIQAINAVDNAYKISKCMIDLEIAGIHGSKEYMNLYNKFHNEINYYMDVYSKDKEIYQNAYLSDIPMRWRIAIDANKLPVDILIGRLLEITSDMEMRYVGDVFARNRTIIPESAGLDAYNTARCFLFTK